MTQHPTSFPSRRSPVIARCCMVATNQPLAALEGLRALMDGGNAADAAIPARRSNGEEDELET